MTTEKWRTIPGFEMFVMSDRGRVAFKSGQHAGRLKNALKSRNSKLHFRLSRHDNGVWKAYKHSAHILFQKIWPNKENPFE